MSIKYAYKHLYEDSCESIARPPGKIKIAPDLHFLHCYKGYGHKVLGEVKNCEEVREANQNAQVIAVESNERKIKHTWRISDLVKKKACCQ